MVYFKLSSNTDIPVTVFRPDEMRYLARKREYHSEIVHRGFKNSFNNSLDIKWRITDDQKKFSTVWRTT